MNRLAKSALEEGRTLTFSRDQADFSDKKVPYPLISLKSVSYEGKAYKLGNYPRVDIAIKAEVTLQDSFTGEYFETVLEVEESADILEQEDKVGEGYIMEGPSIDLDELSVLVLFSSLPMQIRKSDYGA